MEVQESGRWGGSDDIALAPNSFADGRILKGQVDILEHSITIELQLYFHFSTTFRNHFEVVLSKLT
jgi:hypothetical protein